MSAMPSTPTPSDAPGRDWTARESGPRRSVFGNYASNQPEAHGDGATPRRPDRGEVAPSPTRDTALARAFIYRYLAQAFEYPSPDGWQALTSPGQAQSLQAAVTGLGDDGCATACSTVGAELQSAGWQAFHDVYVAAFGHAARGSVPMNEIEYGEPRADALFQPHRLADLAAFYRAFGLNMAADASERQDHLCVELEFLSVLAAKEAYAREGHADADALQACRESQRDFLREHLGRWAPAFARMVADQAGTGPLVSLANLLRAFIEADCARFGVPAGAEQLVVRPVDEAAERLCDGCGLQQISPGIVAEA